MILIAFFVLLIVLVVIGVISSGVAIHVRLSATADQLAPRVRQRLTDCAILLLAIPCLLPRPFFAANVLVRSGHPHALGWMYALPLLPVSAVMAILGRGPGRRAVLCGLGCMFAAAFVGIAVIRSSHLGM